MIFSQRLKELRMECGYTQLQLSEKVGCNQSMIARWESGECEPTLSSLLKLSEILHCTIDYLAGKTDI